MEDKEWTEFVVWCKTQWPMWTPDKMSVDLYLKWKC